MLLTASDKALDLGHSDNLRDRKAKANSTYYLSRIWYQTIRNNGPSMTLVQETGQLFNLIGNITNFHVSQPTLLMRTICMNIRFIVRYFLFYTWISKTQNVFSLKYFQVRSLIQSFDSEPSTRPPTIPEQSAIDAFLLWATDDIGDVVCTYLTFAVAE